MNYEHDLLIELKRGNKEAFTLLFRKYYKDLVLFGGNILHDQVRCEDIVQNIFLKLWADRENIIIEKSLKSFLLRSVQNSCLDELRHKQVIRDHELFTQTFDYFDNLDTENYILYSDLEDKLEVAMSKLPDTYREAFRMNRFEGLKYKEIAKQLKVSERTVEVRVSKALGLLREYLKEFFIAVVALFIS
jgi:RNA polymerase sigma-70 factor (ECF subfamily)